jgi:undecaprenyl diphosphate synthase
MSKLLIKQISDQGDIPSHIAIIMDGNGRWAKSKNLPRIAGHREGINSVREIVRICGELGVAYLTLYTFSSENWKRPKIEVGAIMKLLLGTMNKEIDNLDKNNVRLLTIGNLNDLPKEPRKGMLEGVNKTKNNTGLNLILALSYGGRQELIMAFQRIVNKIEKGEMKSEHISQESIAKELYTSEVPDPELLIRTGGERRISNFLLWQSAYTELYMTDKFWPDFREDEILDSIFDYQNRQRRFGQTGEQVSE